MERSVKAVGDTTERIVLGAPVQRHNLTTCLHNIFANGQALRFNAGTRDITSVEWYELRARLDQMLSLEYPRPVCTDYSISVDGCTMITYDKLENKFVVEMVKT